MLVLGIPGSLRRASYNRMLLEAAGRGLPAHIRFEVLEGLDALPPYNEELDVMPAPHGVRRLRAAVAVADAVLIATPEYNASVPGALKNALDWVSRPYATNVLRGKPVAVIGASQGLFGAIWAQADLRKVLASMGAEVVDAELAVARAQEAFADDGRLADPRLADALRAVVDQLVRPIAARAA